VREQIKNWKQFLNENNVIKEAKPGEIIEVQADNPIKGEVYLTDSDIAYHGGVIDNIEDYLSKTALYLTKKKTSAVSWNKRGHVFTRLYEVKIKKGSKFINFTPAGVDASDNRLNDEKEALLPLGIVGMADNKFRNNIQDKVMSEAIILDKSAIENFRVVPFREILNDENLRNLNLRRDSEVDSALVSGLKINAFLGSEHQFVSIQKFYDAICAKVFRKKYPEITQKIKSGELVVETNPFRKSGRGPIDNYDLQSSIITYIYKNKNIQSEIDNIVESMSNDELREFILSKS
jgi:TusA-related sulfurtransferase